jgi:hypothetical protein
MRVDVREDELTNAIMDAVADGGVHTAPVVAKAVGKRKETVRARMRQLAGCGRLQWVDTGNNATTGYRRSDPKRGAEGLAPHAGADPDCTEPRGAKS